MQEALLQLLGAFVFGQQELVHAGVRMRQVLDGLLCHLQLELWVQLREAPGRSPGGAGREMQQHAPPVLAELRNSTPEPARDLRVPEALAVRSPIVNVEDLDAGDE